HLRVKSALDARGQITFTAASSELWGGIVLEDSGGDNYIQYSLIECAHIGVRIDDEDYVSIISNVLRFNHGQDVYAGAIGHDTDHSIITGNIIYSNTNGIVLEESHYNQITDNEIYDVKRYGLALIGYTTFGGSNNSLGRNKIYRCARDGLRLEKGGHNTVFSNTVYENASSTSYISPSGGIYLHLQNAPTVIHNHVYSNGGASGYQAAIYITRTETSHVDVSRNVVYDDYADAIEYGAEVSNVIEPVMEGNALCSLLTYELQNHHTTTFISAPHNWWGDNSPASGVNYSGPVNITPWITLAIAITPTALPADGVSIATLAVTLRDSDGETVPPPARGIALIASWGKISPTRVTVNDDGIVTVTLTSTQSWPAGGQGVITATAFCGYSTSIIFDISPADLAISKTPHISQVIQGKTITYTVSYPNLGQANAYAVTLTDSFPSRVSWITDTAEGVGWSRVQTRPLVLTRPVLHAEASGSFTLVLGVDESAGCVPVSNTVFITSTTPETATANNVYSVTVNVVGPDLFITKSAEPPLVSAGGALTYTLLLGNDGQADARDVFI
ncbi:MAG: right-handed parallel beta-helix repeat-containing protein, partial [Chloroflexota bacterium]|nr:right-handed parallel beta-helix repeat-containing protein [Chloroflexota bacterium]